MNIELTFDPLLDLQKPGVHIGCIWSNWSMCFFANVCWCIKHLDYMIFFPILLLTAVKPIIILISNDIKCILLYEYICYYK